MSVRATGSHREWSWLALAMVWLALTAWVRPLSLPDEGRYVGVAWGMLQSGDWLVPRLDGLPYFHKPPLFYWLTAASMSLFGPHEWAARLAPWLGAGVGLAALFLFARRWCGEQVPRITLFAAATQPILFIGAQFANLDMLVAGCIGASVLGFAHAVLADSLPSQRATGLAAGYLFAALGVLAKGLIGIALPGLVVFLWLASRLEWRLLLRMVWLPGIVLFAVVAAPWFILMQLRFAEFFHYFFVVQHFSRFTEGSFNNHRPLYFYPVVIALLALPWSAWLPAAWRRDDAAAAAVPGLHRLLWMWMIAITLFFSLPQSKLVGYIFPVCWPLALLVALRLSGSRTVRSARLMRASGVAAVIACLAAITLVSLFPQTSTRDLGVALRTRITTGDRVVLLKNYAFDLPFYARLHQPFVVVEDWQGPQMQRDTWRKELVDAGRFEPALARALLLGADDWTSVLCDGRTTWVIGSQRAAASYPVMQLGQLAFTGTEQALWLLPAGSPDLLKLAGCARTPTANSGGKS